MSTSGWDDKTFLEQLYGRGYLYAETWFPDDPDSDEAPGPLDEYRGQ